MYKISLESPAVNLEVTILPLGSIEKNFFNIFFIFQIKVYKPGDVACNNSNEQTNKKYTNLCKSMNVKVNGF